MSKESVTPLPKFGKGRLVIFHPHPLDLQPVLSDSQEHGDSYTSAQYWRACYCRYCHNESNRRGVPEERPSLHDGPCLPANVHPDNIPRYTALSWVVVESIP